MELVAIYLLGVVIGMLACKLFEEVHGTLKIDRSNPKKDLYRLEVENLDDLAKKRKVRLKVDTKSKISQN